MSEITIRISLVILGAVVSGMVGATFRKLWDERDLLVIEAGRKEALTGAWNGHFEQNLGPGGETPLHGSILLELVRPTRKLVKGNATFTAVIDGKHLPATIHFEGGFRNDRFAALNYVNMDKATVHFGHFLLELSPDGRKLTGKFLGYGFISETLVEGTVELTKADSPTAGA